MNVIKKIFGFIFNPLNTMTYGKGTNKTSEFFSKHPIFIFFIAILISALIYYVCYFVL